MQHHRPHSLAPAKQTAHVAFVTKNFGAHKGISNVGLGVVNAGISKVLRREGYYTESWNAQAALITQDPNNSLEAQIEQSLNRSDAAHHPPLSHVVITSPSWASINDISYLCDKYQNIHFVLVNHTGVAYLQMDANDEHTGIMTNRLAGKLEMERHNFTLAANNTRFIDMVRRTLTLPCTYLPNLYDTETFVTRDRPRAPYDTIRIGGFGAPRPWKNQMVAAQAAIMIARDLGKNLEFFHNKGDWSDEQLARSRRDLFVGERDLKITEIPWESWHTFRRTVSTMDLLVQPSFDETFHLVVADGIAEGVPSVTGACMEWTPQRWWAQPFDPNDVARVGISLLHDPFAIADARQGMIDYQKAALDRWKDFFGR